MVTATTATTISTHPHHYNSNTISSSGTKQRRNSLVSGEASSPASVMEELVVAPVSSKVMLPTNDPRSSGRRTRRSSSSKDHREQRGHEQQQQQQRLPRRNKTSDGTSSNTGTDKNSSLMNLRLVGGHAGSRLIRQQEEGDDETSVQLSVAEMSQSLQSLNNRKVDDEVKHQRRASLSSSLPASACSGRNRRRSGQLLPAQLLKLDATQKLPYQGAEEVSSACHSITSSRTSQRQRREEERENRRSRVHRSKSSQSTRMSTTTTTTTTTRSTSRRRSSSRSRLMSKNSTRKEEDESHQTPPGEDTEERRRDPSNSSSRRPRSKSSSKGRHSHKNNSNSSMNHPSGRQEGSSRRLVNSSGSNDHLDSSSPVRMRDASLRRHHHHHSSSNSSTTDVHVKLAKTTSSSSSSSISRRHQVCPERSQRNDMDDSQQSAGSRRSKSRSHRCSGTTTIGPPTTKPTQRRSRTRSASRDAKSSSRKSRLDPKIVTSEQQQQQQQQSSKRSEQQQQQEASKFPRNDRRGTVSAKEEAIRDGSDQHHQHRRRHDSTIRTHARSSSRPAKQQHEEEEEKKSAMKKEAEKEEREENGSRPPSKKPVDLDQSLNCLLSAYNNNAPQYLAGKEQELQDSFSTTGSESTKTSLNDPQSPSLAAGSTTATTTTTTKKKKSLASRVKGKLSGSTNKDKKVKRDDEQLLTTLEPDATMDSSEYMDEPHTSYCQDTMDASLYSPLAPTAKSSGGGLGSLAKRMGRRLSLKVKEKPSEGGDSKNDIHMDDDDHTNNDESFSESHSSVATPSVTASSKKGGKTLLGGLRFKTKKADKVPKGMTLLGDNESFGSVDRAILETANNMQQAMKEFDRGDVNDSHLALENNEKTSTNELTMDATEDEVPDLHLMKSFAQLDFAALQQIGLNDGNRDGGENADIDQQLRAAESSSAVKPELVVRRNHGNHRRSSSVFDSGKGQVAENGVKKRRRKKTTPTRSQTTDGTECTADAPFDWKKHSGRERRSKSLSTLRASAQRQKQRKSGLPKNAPRGGLATQTNGQNLDDSEESFDPSLLSESMPEEKRKSRAGASMPALQNSMT